jgi:hypothetical protein
MVRRRSVAAQASTIEPREGLPLYSVYRVEPKQLIGPARSIDHALILAEAAGPGRYEVFVVGDAPRHLCFVTKHEDGTFTLDPRQVGSVLAVLGDTLTRA